MADKVALVTGASRGIGRATAIQLGGAGFCVAVNYLRDRAAAEETVIQLVEAGGEGFPIQADVGVTEDVVRLVKEVESTAGKIDVLVNNAGIRSDGLSLRMSDAAWDEVVRTNLTGTFLCCRQVLRSMVSVRRGRVINVASVAGLRASPGQANYSAAKAGVIALTRTLATEVAARGITVNAVAPGLVETDLTSDLSDEQNARFHTAIPLGRSGTSEEVGRLVRFLCSEEAAYITGSVFTIDGGLTA